MIEESFEDAQNPTEITTTTRSASNPEDDSLSIIEIILLAIFSFVAFTAVVLPPLTCFSKKNLAQFATFYFTVLIAVALTGTQLGFYVTDKFDDNTFYGSFGLTIFFAISSSIAVMK
ncbi:Oidioi.mRNA.OKI2018_I69.PAR.g9054.t1.cds [Oikopleura dioica]|uniref:Oidioi.mRNA.OKI2018_I69.PAR.g9054.t1.cds n=1 Tax=Oikopleura dioica TaxID=34765 RepID=A0ABN7RIT8_OIKDI|nr:Oidioi.mRNA.OKI2018_I69.PAR.g9054.t1.cds [Oikopleura dioica]